MRSHLSRRDNKIIFKRRSVHQAPEVDSPPTLSITTTTDRYVQNLPLEATSLDTDQYFLGRAPNPTILTANPLLHRQLIPHNPFDSYYQ